MAKFGTSTPLMLLLILFPSDNECVSSDHSTTYEQFYELGMDAYRQEKWSKCSTFIQKAIDDYHFYKNAIIDCRLKCRSNSSEEFSLVKLQFFHEMLEDSNCLRRCKKKTFGMRPDGPQPSVLDKKFEKRAPYNFLQFCLFMEGKLKEAVATAYTFYISNQDDQRIVENLQYYRNQDGLIESDFVDLERTPHQSVYVKALMAYNDGDWTTAAEQFEMALKLYFKEEDRCRAGCERSFTHTGYPDFVSAVADHYIVVIVCQQKCLQKLSTFGMEELENFVSEHYNYLQFAYYNVQDYDKAAIAVANFLLFRPDDSEMNTNKDYYIKNVGLSEDKFTPSQEAIDYINYWRDVERSLDFVRDKYALPNDDIKDEEDKDENASKTKEGNEMHYMAKYAKVGIKLFAESEKLKGPLRFAADEFFREDQCLSLADLAKSQKPNKLGIRSISLSEALKLVKEDGEYEMSLRLILRGGAIIQHYTAAYFNQSELYIKEVKVICRAGGDKWEKEMPKDCVPQEDGSCLGDSQNDSGYLSIAYLNDIIDGTGSFYFMDSQHKMQSSLQPRCGRLVGFATNNSYGVNFSWKKERCAVLMTFTSDPDLETADVQSAKDILQNLEEAMVNESKSLNNTAIMNEFYRQGVSVVQTGEDLFGKERFAADGLATETECQELIDLARKHGKSGDGYRGNKFPHTDREIFTGLDIPSVLQLVTTNKVSAHSLQLLLDISEQGRLLVESYFNLSKPLFFDFTHLVCRTAVEVDEDENRDKDLSHPVHSDNCMIQDDGTCVPDDLTFSQRHYSALMYLNGDFDGGEFFFAHNNRSEQVSLRPKCGRIVGFNAGEYHGVKAVTNGQRCALAMWLTHDPNFKEISRYHTQRELDKLSNKSKLDKTRKSKKSKASDQILNENSNLEIKEMVGSSKPDIIETDEVEKLQSEKESTLEDTVGDADKEISFKIEETVESSKLESEVTENLQSGKESILAVSKSDSDKDIDISKSDSDKETGIDVQDTDTPTPGEELDTRDEL